MSRHFEGDIGEEEYVETVIGFIRECGGLTTTSEIGSNVPRPEWLLGPLGRELLRFGFDVNQNQVREGSAAFFSRPRIQQNRVRRREEGDEDISHQPAPKRRNVQGRTNLWVSADVSRIVMDPVAPFEYRLEPAAGEEQKRYQEALESNTPIIFVLGTAGTGKTLLAAQEGLRRLQTSQVRRIILTRPAVEADDRMGFLPGSLGDKLQPFVAPALEAIDRQAGPGTARMLMNKDKIKLAALSHMRGSTMDDSFILADEMQNATFEQLRMLTTRHGKGSKLIICGDPQQSDRFSAGSASPLVTVAEEVEQSAEPTFRTIRLHQVQRSEVAEKALDLWARIDQKRRHVAIVPPSSAAAVRWQGGQGQGQGQGQGLPARAPGTPGSPADWPPEHARASLAGSGLPVNSDPSSIFVVDRVGAGPAGGGGSALQVNLNLNSVD